MSISGRKEHLLLFFGDMVVFALSLWVTLFLRHFSPPKNDFFFEHFIPFLPLFFLWVGVFFISGLYEKHTRIFQNRLPSTLFSAQVANISLAVLFFYLSPFEDIAPKTTLLIYLLVSSVLIILWRLRFLRVVEPRRREKAIIIGGGREVDEIIEEINNNPRYPLSFVSSVDVDRSFEEKDGEKLFGLAQSEKVSVMVIDFDNIRIQPLLPFLYRLIGRNVRFFNMHSVYEEVFDRTPLSILRHSWFLENISAVPRIASDFLKRGIDIAISLPLLILSLPLYPLVYLLVKIDDGGPLFIFQDRIGERGRPIQLAKFRTMSFDDSKNATVENRVTRVGRFLRASRVDELPQLWSVLFGSLSLIGPRPELPSLVSEYERAIPYYAIRHLIRPGLSGWAQIRDTDAPRRFADIEKTRKKLSYDLFYLKNRSLFLDIKIILKTIKTLLSRSGR